MLVSAFVDIHFYFPSCLACFVLFCFYSMDSDWKVDCSDDENYGLNFSATVWQFKIRLKVVSISKLCMFSSANVGYPHRLLWFNFWRVTAVIKTAIYWILTGCVLEGKKYNLVKWKAMLKTKSSSTLIYSSIWIFLINNTINRAELKKSQILTFGMNRVLQRSLDLQDVLVLEWVLWSSPEEAPRRKPLALMEFSPLWEDTENWTS